MKVLAATADWAPTAYSVRLFTEQYLRGTVHFTSSEASGTTFMVTLPRDPTEPRP